jgi:hypothetical protein
LRIDVRDRLEEAAAESERVNGQGVILISKELADEVVAEGVPAGVSVMGLERLKPGVYELHLRRDS